MAEPLTRLSPETLVLVTNKGYLATAGKELLEVISELTHERVRECLQFEVSPFRT